MPAFMAGMGMRQGMPRRQFNEQQPQANQFTQALNQGAGAANVAGTPNTQGQGPAQQPTQQNNPYAQNSNPWSYDPQQGYQPNSSAWAPEWMKPKPVAPVAPKIKQQTLKNYTPYADDMMGSGQQAADLLKAEAAKRGKNINIDEIVAKYGGQTAATGGKVSGKLYNQIAKDLFSEEEEVDDPNWKAPETKPVEKPGYMPPNPNAGMWGMGGMGGRPGMNSSPYFRNPNDGRNYTSGGVTATGDFQSGGRPYNMDSAGAQGVSANTGGIRMNQLYDDTMYRGEGASAQVDPTLNPQQQQEAQNKMIANQGNMQKYLQEMMSQKQGMQGMGGMFSGYPGMQGGWGGY